MDDLPPVAPRSTARSYHVCLPKQRALFYGGSWHEPSGGYANTYNPGNGETLGQSAIANKTDVAAAVAAAKVGFSQWRHSKPLERGALLRRIALVIRENAEELAMVDAANCGNPIAELIRDSAASATYIEFFAGIAPEIKGSTMPLGAGVVNLTHREPVGVVARIVAYNHPLLFSARSSLPRSPPETA